MRATGTFRKAGRRRGFTLIEAIIVLALLGIMGAMAAPSVTSSMANTRADRASLAITTEIESAFSLASRQRKPVKVVVDAANIRMTIRDRATSNVLRSRSFGMKESPYGVNTISASSSTITVFPNGLTNGAFTISITVAGRTRTVSVSRTGNMRVS